MEITLTQLGVFIATAIVFFRLMTKGIELLRMSKIERLLLSDHKRITLLIVQITLFVLIVPLILTSIIFIFEPDKRIEVFLGIYIVFMALSLVFILMMFFFNSLLPVKKRHFYIEEQLSEESNTEKWYIHKLTIDQDVILSKEQEFNNLYSNVILRKKEYLYGKMIRLEPEEIQQEKIGLFKSIIKFFKPKTKPH